jgi:ATP-dependent Lhr-like helicase
MMTGFERAIQYFQTGGKTPFDFQTQAWRNYLAGQSGLLQAPTGMGKTLAAAMGPIIDWMDHYPEIAAESLGKYAGESDLLAAPRTGEFSSPIMPKHSSLRDAAKRGSDRKKRDRNKSAPLTILWITPLRALAADTAESLQPVIDALQLPWTVELRTADTSASVRKKQRDRLPTVLITTPESLSLLLSYPGTAERFGHLQSVVVDEWHELIGAWLDFGISARCCASGDCLRPLLTPKNHWQHWLDRPTQRMRKSCPRRMTNRSKSKASFLRKSSAFPGPGIWARAWCRM